MAAHFAHEGDSACSGALESALHLLAKEVLEDRKRLLLPAVEAEVDGVRVRLHPAREMAFDDAVLEQRLEGITPDIIVHKSDRDLLVEIHVTHACDEVKVAKIRALGVSAIEIDLSKLSRTASRQDVEAAVIGMAPRVWLFNPKVDEARRRAAEKVAARKLERELRLARNAEKLAARWDVLVGKPFEDRCPEFSETLRLVDEYGYLDHVGLGSSGSRAFEVEPAYWQAVLFKAAVMDRPPLYAVHAGVNMKDALAVLKRRGLVADLFTGDLSLEVIAAVKATRPSFRTPQGLVAAYFNHLARAGLLEVHEERWRTPRSVRSAVDAKRRAFLDAWEREQDLHRRVAALLNAAGPDAVGFDIEDWHLRQIDLLECTPAECARLGGDRWEAFQKHLASIREAIDADGTKPTLLGLPVAGAIRRAAEKRAAAAAERRRQAIERKEMEMRGREHRLREAGCPVLGVGLDEWLHAPGGGEEGTRLDAARGSEEMLRRLLSHLSRLHYDRLEADRLAGVAAANRKTLGDAASEARGEQWADIFLRNPHPALENRRPFDACVDASTLVRCVALIQASRGSRQRR